MPRTPEIGITTMEEDIRRRVRGGYYQAPEATNDALWLLAHIDFLVAERDGLREALSDVDAILSDPVGHPLDAINQARRRIAQESERA